jgi:glycosyltransferase involved in cell wall biosynthesis
MEVDYSVIVPAFNEAGWLPRTIPALQQAMAALPFHGEIIVTDNNSTDATAEIAGRLGARVLFEPVNQISRARNTGARAARGKYLVFVDADTIVPSALLAQALDNLESKRCVGGGAIVQFEQEMRGLVHLGVALWNLLSRTLRLAAGCFFYCRKSDYEEAGGFSEAVYASEEIWLSRKLRRIGQRQGRKFCIINQYAALSSGRKIGWYSTGRQIRLILMVMFFPFFVRYRRFCGYWYDRHK